MLSKTFRRFNEPVQLAINAAGKFLINPHTLADQPEENTFGSLFLLPATNFSTEETTSGSARISSLSHLQENITRAASSGLGAIDVCEKGRASSDNHPMFYSILPSKSPLRHRLAKNYVIV